LRLLVFQGSEGDDVDTFFEVEFEGEVAVSVGLGEGVIVVGDGGNVVLGLSDAFDGGGRLIGNRF